MNIRIFFWAGLFAASVFSMPIAAQNAAAKAAAKVGDDVLNIKANKATGKWGDKQGLQLEGTRAQPALIQHPQLDVAAPQIDVSFDDNRDPKNVVAKGGVQFKVSLTQQNGAPVRLEAKCEEATLERTPQKRVLTLKGGVDGWFQSANGPRNQLRGQTVKLTSQPEAATTLFADIEGDERGVRVDVPPARNNANAQPITMTAHKAQLRFNAQNELEADVDGGAQGVRLEIPAPAGNDNNANNGNNANAANGLSLGAVVVTSQRASVRQAEGVARFSGNAQATSLNAGADDAKFDVRADELVVTRGANGAIETLGTKGRAQVKLDLPADKDDKKAEKADAKADAKPAKDNKISFGNPNYLEIAADGAKFELPKNTLTFEGNIQGFYRLPLATQQGTQFKDYDFLNVHRAEFTYAPEQGGIARGLSMVLTKDLSNENAPQVEIKLPGIRF